MRSDAHSIEISSADLAPNLHAVPNRDHAALLRRLPVDFYQTFETNAHHAVRCSWSLPYHARSKVVDTADEQCGCNTEARWNRDGLAFKGNGH